MSRSRDHNGGTRFIHRAAVFVIPLLNSILPGGCPKPKLVYLVYQISEVG